MDWEYTPPPNPRVSIPQPIPTSSVTDPMDWELTNQRLIKFSSDESSIRNSANIGECIILFSIVSYFSFLTRPPRPPALVRSYFILKKDRSVNAGGRSTHTIPSTFIVDMGGCPLDVHNSVYAVISDPPNAVLHYVLPF